jgi:uncharacterized membrane protein
VPGQYYTQVNILFPASQVELPAADKFAAFPPEAQKAILLAFNKEQNQRHEWLRTQQKIDHDLNTRSQLFNFFWKISGMVSGVIIILAMIGFGVYLIKIGASAFGVSMIISAIAGLVGTAVYGHRAISPQQQPSKPVALPSQKVG